MVDGEEPAAVLCYLWPQLQAWELCMSNCMEQWPSQDGLVCEINPFQEIRIKTAFSSIFSQEEKKIFQLRTNQRYLVLKGVPDNFCINSWSVVRILGLTFEVFDSMGEGRRV